MSKYGLWFFGKVCTFQKFGKTLTLFSLNSNWHYEIAYEKLI